MKKVKLKIYTKSKKTCAWTDKKKYLIHFRVLQFFVRHGMVVDKVHEIVSFTQSKWLEKYIRFNTQKRKLPKNDFQKRFYNLPKSHFMEK